MTAPVRHYFVRWHRDGQEEYREYFFSPETAHEEYEDFTWLWKRNRDRGDIITISVWHDEQIIESETVEGIR